MPQFKGSPRYRKCVDRRKSVHGKKTRSEHVAFCNVLDLVGCIGPSGAAQYSTNKCKHALRVLKRWAKQYK